ncbi:GWxTD domain-containing protein [Sediminitomix flava]|uniref:GWxTD domain-containing protein n=1 Tax=Sediminitomix flava TaxID=379075 RepID=A0A315Z640_SEDFL|nr:GWxTD domain-containing protein [Sediminitomix flava]PWJ39124.1 GWxTD domain-containing protein [Sediminitomix flava]
MKAVLFLLIISSSLLSPLLAQSALEIRTSAPTYPNYVRVDDTLKVFSNELSYVNGVKIKDQYSVAIPPMEEDTVVEFRLKQEIENTFTVNQDRAFILAEKGLYVFFADSVDKVNTQSVLVTRKDFPKYKSLFELMRSLAYITNDEEYRAIWKSNDSLEAFGGFWLKLGKTEAKAQKLIKEYYQRVAYANEHYSSYKEGWRTDRGMVRIVYGKPQNIKSENGKETWYYTIGGKSVIFEFVYTPNKLSQKTYILTRSERYKESWYSAIKKWRQGIL